MSCAGDDGGGITSRTLDQHIIIKSVQRFTNLKHGIVGDIYDVIDWAHAGQLESVLHPIWTGLNGDILNQPKHKARIQFRFGDLNRSFIGNIWSFCLYQVEILGDM